jgi:hypothetical protein
MAELGDLLRPESDVEFKFETGLLAKKNEADGMHSMYPD